MTIDEVKQELPNVLIKWNGKVWYARVTGRLNDFATVSPFQQRDARKKYNPVIIGPCFHYSWPTVTNAVNENRILTV